MARTIYKIRKDPLEKFMCMTIDDIIRHVREFHTCKFYKENGDLIHIPFVENTSFICHRVNEISKLSSIPTMFGVEIDVRDDQHTGGLMLCHDPWVKGTDLEEYLCSYKHSTMILNIKSERVEPQCLDILKSHKMDNFFFLDSSFPMMTALSKQGEHRYALRISEYEPLPALTSTWVWVDCFTRFPLNHLEWSRLKAMGKKVCVVSPELQQRPEDIPRFRKLLIQENIVPDAICCKLERIYDWI